MGAHASGILPRDSTDAPGPRWRMARVVLWRVALGQRCRGSHPGARYPIPVGRTANVQPDDVLKALQARFPDRNVQRGRDSAEVAFVPSAHPGFGDLSITMDSEEITVFVGNITHCHFEYDASLADDPARTVAMPEALLRFLAELFSDRRVVWKAFGPLVGGSYLRRDAEPVRSGLIVRRFVWSGPLR